VYRSVPARCLAGCCRCFGELGDELGGREIAEARMRAHGVVVHAPGFDDCLGFGPGAEPLQARNRRLGALVAGDLRGRDCVGPARMYATVLAAPLR
jgi:hypothetical protein